MENKETSLPSSFEQLLYDELASGNWKQHAQKNPLNMLKRSLIINICWGIVISIGLLMLLWVDHILILLGLTIMLVFNIIVIGQAIKIYLNLRRFSIGQVPLLQALKYAYQSISTWMKVQQKIALFIYPISASAGFLFGGMIGADLPPEEFMFKKPVWITFIFIVPLLVVVSHFLAKWMFKISFGKHLIALQERIDELEKES